MVRLCWLTVLSDRSTCASAEVIEILRQRYKVCTTIETIVTLVTNGFVCQ